ncbi:MULTISPECIES: SDR family oxidoreductase [unclassified Mesorhizobium]|uniref:SDR family oxidoreductase n=1 Tax=unclassified Mesorhizobium TaxID=325217 RepID=UPI00333CC871
MSAVRRLRRHSAIARTLSGELIGRGIRANVISPGPIDTPLNDKLGLGPVETKARAKAVVGMVPAGRFGTAEEIANAVVFLASRDNASRSAAVSTSTI